jgi:DnaJ-class molecular chaperone
MGCGCSELVEDDYEPMGDRILECPCCEDHGTCGEICNGTGTIKIYWIDVFFDPLRCPFCKGAKKRSEIIPFSNNERFFVTCNQCNGTGIVILKGKRLIASKQS